MICLSLPLFVCLQVQLQLLTAIVKLFLKKPTETQELVQQVLSLATQVGNGSRTREELPRGFAIPPQGSGNGLGMQRPSQEANNWSLILDELIVSPGE